MMSAIGMSICSVRSVGAHGEPTSDSQQQQHEKYEIPSPHRALRLHRDAAVTLVIGNASLPPLNLHERWASSAVVQIPGSPAETPVSDFGCAD
jgi:hypothetical protein